MGRCRREVYVKKKIEGRRVHERPGHKRWRKRKRKVGRGDVGRTGKREKEGRKKNRNGRKRRRGEGWGSRNQTRE